MYKRQAKFYNLPNGRYRVVQPYRLGSETGETEYAAAEFILEDRPQKGFALDTQPIPEQYAGAQATEGVTLELDEYSFGGSFFGYKLINDTDYDLTLDREGYIQVLLDGEWQNVVFPGDHDLPIEGEVLKAHAQVSKSMSCDALPIGKYRVFYGFMLKDSTVGYVSAEFEIAQNEQ